VQEYKKNVKPGARKDTLSSLLAARDDEDKGLTEMELVANSIILIGGGTRFPLFVADLEGTDTTAVTLTYILYNLAKHPEYIDKICKEVAGYTDIDSLKSIELEKLEYMNAVIKESMRIFPPFASVLGRVVPPGGKTFGGNFIPGGVTPHLTCITDFEDHHLTRRRGYNS
jgi:cytochrome P450